MGELYLLYILLYKKMYTHLWVLRLIHCTFLCVTSDNVLISDARNRNSPCANQIKIERDSSVFELAKTWLWHFFRWDKWLMDIQKLFNQEGDAISPPWNFQTQWQWDRLMATIASIFGWKTISWSDEDFGWLDAEETMSFLSWQTRQRRVL